MYTVSIIFIVFIVQFAVCCYSIEWLFQLEMTMANIIFFIEQNRLLLVHGDFKFGGLDGISAIGSLHNICVYCNGTC